MARHRAGLANDPEEVDALLVRLGGVAGLEAWWLTAEVAACFAVPRWSDLAARRARELVAVAGPFAESLRRAAELRLA